MFDSLGLMIVLVLLPYAIMVLMWSWRALLICGAVLGAPAAALWIQHFCVVQSPGYHVGVGGAIGIVSFAFFSVGLVWGFVVRVVSLTVSEERPSFTRTLAINTGAFLLLTGVAGAIQAGTLGIDDQCRA